MSIYFFCANLRQKNAILNNASLSEEEKEAQINNITLFGKPIQNMELNFVDMADNPLIEGGENIIVNIDNIDMYVDKTLDRYIGSGIAPLINIFREGFNSIFNIDKLKIYNQIELDTLLCGLSDSLLEWNMKDLVDNIKFTRGLTASSSVSQYLIETLCEFTIAERRQFLQFLTGCPRLPVGGIKTYKTYTRLQRIRIYSNTKRHPSIQCKLLPTLSKHMLPLP